MHRPRMDDYEKAYFSFRWDVPPTFNFGADVIDAYAQEDDKTALIWCNADGVERTFSFADISDLSSRFANVLKDHGIEKGDRVIIMLPRIPEWQIAMIGCIKCGAVPIPCVTMLTAKDIDYRVDHAEVRAAVTTADNIGKFDSTALEARFVIGKAKGWTSVEAVIDRASADFTPPPIKSTDPAVMYYTSGSTGEPKGVVHAARALFAWRVSAWFWNDLHPDDVMWCTADTGWSKAGSSILFGPWSCGAAVFCYDGPFDEQRRFELLERYRVTVFCAAATELRRLIQFDPVTSDLSRLRLTISAGESVNAEIVKRWQELSGGPLLDGYGQTETLMTVLNYPSMSVKPGSMGRPLPGTSVAVLDEQNQVAPVDKPGRLAVRLPNPQFMLGYWKDDAQTQRNLIRVGGHDYFTTGDRASVDSDGYLFYQGRADDVINSAGYRIGPLEVENALIAHEAVQECAAVASPDPERGEIVKAFVVLVPGNPATTELVRELQEYAKAATAPYKYPRRIEFVPDLPKTVTGKIKRRELRDREYGVRSEQQERDPRSER